MREWFFARYEDPQNQTPYDSEEGQYIFIWGGPYDPRNELTDRFEGVVDNSVINELAQDLLMETGDEWAPVHHDYDDDFLFENSSRELPLHSLVARVAEISNVLALDVKEHMLNILLQMSHGSLIAALEAYLADTFSYWVQNNELVLRNIVVRNKDFKDRKLELSEIFNRMENIREEVLTYLQDQIWHRLDKISRLLIISFEIKVPEINDLMLAVIVRHDIVHRAGKTKDGEEVNLSLQDIEALRGNILDFAIQLEAELREKFPE